MVNLEAVVTGGAQFYDKNKSPRTLHLVRVSLLEARQWAAAPSSQPKRPPSSHGLPLGCVATASRPGPLLVRTLNTCQGPPQDIIVVINGQLLKQQAVNRRGNAVDLVENAMFPGRRGEKGSSVSIRG